MLTHLCDDTMLAPFYEALLHRRAGIRDWIGEVVGVDRIWANVELGHT
jgi:hypothetical protein